MLFFAYAVIYGGQFNSYYFVADFGCSAKKLAEIPQRALRNLKYSISIWSMNYFVSICKVNLSKTFHV